MFLRCSSAAGRSEAAQLSLGCQELQTAPPVVLPRQGAVLRPERHQQLWLSQTEKLLQILRTDISRLREKAETRLVAGELSPEAATAAAADKYSNPRAECARITAAAAADPADSTAAETLRAHFHLTHAEAAERLRLTVRKLKRVQQRYSFESWPRGTLLPCFTVIDALGQVRAGQLHAARCRMCAPQHAQQRSLC